MLKWAHNRNLEQNTDRLIPGVYLICLLRIRADGAVPEELWDEAEVIRSPKVGNKFLQIWCSSRMPAIALQLCSVFGWYVYGAGRE